ncbi:BrnA antitoxin family protein [Labrys okinawensis]|uniref:BrnA antitoxin family protein n=1 Tax=Labrys okinawensis TaxID=346911 RepID=UPI0039BCF005
MNSKVVRRVVDLANLPPLTAEQKAELAALAARPDSDIDTSDIPELGEEFWQKAVRNPLYRPTKTSTTVRIDSDVLLWLRSQGKGYQSRLNAILRREMIEALKAKKRA